MDISRNEDGDVLTALGGCRKCGSRIITCFIEETSAWLKDHQKRHHTDELSSIDQVGDPLNIKTPNVHRIVALLEGSGERMSVDSIAKELDQSYNTTSVALNRLLKSGQVTKLKVGNMNLWKAA